MVEREKNLSRVRTHDLLIEQQPVSRRCLLSKFFLKQHGADFSFQLFFSSHSEKVAAFDRKMQFNLHVQIFLHRGFPPTISHQANFIPRQFEFFRLQRIAWICSMKKGVLLNKNTFLLSFGLLPLG